jgi:hypothetical protein
MSDLDLLDLIDRYSFLSTKYGTLALELAPKLEQFNKYRKELQFLVEQIEKKGVKPQDSEGIKKIIQEELDKRNSEGKKE